MEAKLFFFSFCRYVDDDPYPKLWVPPPFFFFPFLNKRNRSWVLTHVVCQGFFFFPFRSQTVRRRSVGRKKERKKEEKKNVSEKEEKWRQRFP